MDIIKPLKIENSANGGTEIDIFPTEVDILEDYVGIKGVALEADSSKTIDLTGLGEIRFKDAVETTPITVRQLREADQNLFDNTLNGFVATNVQEAIEEVSNKAQTAVYFSRNSTISAGSYLQAESIPSNVTGPWVFTPNAAIKKVFVSNELSTTYKIEVLYHFGNESGLTSLGTITVTAAKGGSYAVDFPVSLNTQLAVRLALDSPNSVKNIVCGLEVIGTN